MTLLEMIAARQCRVQECSEDRAAGFRFCPTHVNDDFCRRLDYLPDGRVVVRRALRAREDASWRVAA